MIYTTDPITGERRINPSVDMLIHDHILRFQQQGGPRACDLQRVAGYAGYIAQYSDGINSGKPFKEHRVLGKIAESVAVLSFLPGGWTFCGKHYETLSRKRENYHNTRKFNEKGF